MTWMLTASGARFDLEFVASNAVDIADIAHHLSQINRYTGACARPYSVAEHSLLVCDILHRQGHTDPWLLLAGLLHDAHEAYTNDLSSPMKQAVGAAWHDVEARVEQAVQIRFGLHYTCALDRAGPQHIKHADLTALVTERWHLLPAGGPRWPAENEHTPVDWYDFDGHAGTAHWAFWRVAFLNRFYELRRAAMGDAA